VFGRGEFVKATILVKAVKPRFWMSLSALRKGFLIPEEASSSKSGGLTWVGAEAGILN